jgi:RND family efflux transporter MFP subunit
VALLRRRFAAELPDAEVFFLAPDITTQVLDFGVSAPIDVQVTGPLANNAQNHEIAQRLRASLAHVRGAVDVHLAQVVSQPELRVDVDRTEASQSGVTQRDVATDALISPSSSTQIAPSFWLDPRKGLQYPVAIQTPQRRIDSVAALADTPVHLPGKATPQVLGNLASFRRDTTAVNVTHYNVLSTFDVQANVQGADLGSVADAIDRLVSEARKTLPRGTSIVVRGQVESMNASFRGLSYGIVAAVVLVYLLLVVNFQSWRDPLIILMSLPGALAGIAWLLFATGTTLSVPALMGAIMSIGVATSNSILVVAFANERIEEGESARRAAFLAGVTRLRPVVMTALAMVLGMLPMSLGLGEGGEQNAPLARAVIGGLTVATLTTLFFVPVVYSSWRSSSRARSDPRSPAMTMTMTTQETDPAPAPGATHEGEVFEPVRPSRRALGRGLGALALVRSAAIAAGVIPRVRHGAAMEREERAVQAVVPSLRVAPAERDAAAGPLVLPGTVRPLQETTMYARASGYVRKWYVDLGETVKKGQALADLDLPDVDEELRQAIATAAQSRATVAQATSQLGYARTTDARYAALLPVGLVTQQQADQFASQSQVQQASLAAAEAALASTEANARRVKELRAYGTITAPFDGVVTLRAAETGQLVAAGTGQGQALYRIAEDDVVRIFVDVPQLYAAGVQPGVAANVTIREAAGRVFHGTIARTSRELDAASRTLRVEVDIPNRDRALVSGMYANVAFAVERQDAPLFVPATSVVIDAAGTRVAVVRDGAVHWQKVEVAADLGDRLALAAGLAEGDTVAVTPSARLREGQAVAVASAP